MIKRRCTVCQAPIVSAEPKKTVVKNTIISWVTVEIVAVIIGILGTAAAVYGAFFYHQ